VLLSEGNVQLIVISPFTELLENEIPVGSEEAANAGVLVVVINCRSNKDAPNIPRILFNLNRISINLSNHSPISFGE
jgi:hypothetical protein